MFYTFYRKFGNKILFRYIDDEGVHRSKTVDFYKPSLFLDAGDNEPDAHSIYGEPLRKKTFDSIKDANEFAKDHQHISGFNIQGNSRFDNQFLIELFEGGIPEYDSSLIDIGYIDIETDYDDFPDPIHCKYPIQQVDIASTRDNIHYSFGLKPYNHKHRDEEDPLVNKMEVVHEHFDTEEEMLKAMILHFENRGWYDLTSGLNSEEFDIPYIINRVSKVIGSAWAKRLSPYKTVFEKEKKNRFGNVVTVYDIVGMPHLDYMKVYEKHTHDPIENFKLETIAQKELGRGKVSDDDDRSLKQLWEEDPDHYIFYNIVDVQLLVEIDKVTGLMDLIFALSYITLSNYEDAMATNKMWENLIARHLYNQSIAPFYEPNAESFRDYEGAYVHPPVPGKHRWVVGFDLASLYPHIIQQCNIGVESIVEPNNWTPDIQRMREPDMVNSLLSKSVDTTPVKDEDLSLTANGQVYTKDQPSFLSQIMKMLYEERKVYKKRMKDCKEKGDKDGATKNNNMQMGMKILLNSGYGAVANKHFLYYRVENAEAITLTGQLVNRWCGQHLNELLQGMFGDGNYWVAGDSVSDDTKIRVQNQGQVNIEDCFLESQHKAWGKEYYFPKDMNVLTYDWKTNQTCYKPVKYVMRHKADKKMYRVWSNHTEYIDVTEDHSLMCYDSLSSIRKRDAFMNGDIPPIKEAKPTDINSSLVSLKRIPENNVIDTQYPIELFELFGFFVGDGSIKVGYSKCEDGSFDEKRKINISFGEDTQECCEKILDPLKEKGFVEDYTIQPNGYDVYVRMDSDYIFKEGFYDRTGKRVPEWVKHVDFDSKAAFIRGYFSADGTVMVRGNRCIIRLTSVDEKLIDEVKEIMYTLSIPTSKYRSTTENHYDGVYSGSYSVYLTVKDNEMFKTYVGFCIDRKECRLNYIKENTRTKKSGGFDFSLCPVKKVEEIEYDGYVYDIEVDDTHVFFANDYLVHNTDSLYFTLAPVGDAMMNKGYSVQETVDKLDEMCEVLIKKLHGFCADLAQYLNSYKQAMTWEREVISETAIWVAKKKYSMKVWDDEGDRYEDDPKYKIMGLESVRSSTPQWSKGYLVECYEIALEGDEDKLHDRVAEIEREFYDMDINKIAIPSGVNNIMKYYDSDTIYAKGTPKHVKGVLIHNWLIDQKGIKRIPKILKDGSKIKYVSLKKPNPINQEVVAFDGELPPEFGLDRFVNRREIFVKAFLDPLQIYLDAIGWNYEPVNTLL